MRQADYAYGVAYIRALENKLLDKSDIESLILCKTPEEAMRVLADKGYGSEPCAPQDFEKLLKAQQQLCWETVREVMPKGASLDILMYENDFHNIKVMIKATFAGVKEYKHLFLEPGTLDAAQIEQAISTKNFGLLQSPFKEAAEYSYSLLAETEDSQLSDIALDKAAMDAMMQAANESGSSFIKEFVTLKNALSDIKIAYRAQKTEKDRSFLEKALSKHSAFNREALIENALSNSDALFGYIESCNYGEAVSALKEGISAFEKYADEKITAFTEQAKYVILGVEPLLAFILKKQAELLSVRIILSCKINGFSEQEIRERLRG
ncbi:MAG: V-type ATPase subunit [Clostridia bacterium]|nr:V-type ATPase subunit [Clostridia bacterium]